MIWRTPVLPAKHRLAAQKKSPHTVTSTASTGASKSLYQARLRTVAFQNKIAHLCSRQYMGLPRAAAPYVRPNMAHVRQSRLLGKSLQPLLSCSIFARKRTDCG